MLVGILQILLQSHRNRRCFRRTGLDLYRHAALDHGLLGRSAEHADAPVFLFEIRELIEHGLDLQGREKSDDVVLDVLQVQDVAVHRALHRSLARGSTSRVLSLGFYLST